MTAPALTVQDIWIAYGAHDVVRGVSFHVDPHEIVGLVGPNGCGKTTLLRGLAGVGPFQRGMVHYGERPMGALNTRERAVWRGYVPQFYEHASEIVRCRVEDVVAMGVAHRHPLFVSDVTNSEVEDALSEVGLAGYGARLFKTLSGGEQQLVHIARSIVHQPRLLLLDEPTSALDIAHRLAVLRILRGRVLQTNGGMGVLLSIHDLNTAAMVCDRIVLMYAGKIVCDGTPQDVFTAKIIRQVYGVEAVCMPHPIQQHKTMIVF